MLESRHCGCTICSVERSLELHLGTSPALEAYAMLFANSPALAAFPTASSLLLHLRSMRHVHGSGQAADEVFRALREGVDEAGGMAEVLLLRAVIPVLHAVVSSALRTYPRLDREDVAQQTITVFFVVVHSKDWRRRETHLAYTLAREIRRDVSTWVRTEVGSPTGTATGVPPEHSISAADLFERNVQLKHFLDRSVRSGALDNDDLNLLNEFKLDRRMAEKRKGPVTNAVRQRMKKLLSKMRRLARTNKTFARTEKQRHVF